VRLSFAYAFGVEGEVTVRVRAPGVPTPFPSQGDPMQDALVAVVPEEGVNVQDHPVVRSLPEAELQLVTPVGQTK